MPQVMYSIGLEAVQLLACYFEFHVAFSAGLNFFLITSEEKAGRISGCVSTSCMTCTSIIFPYGNMPKPSRCFAAAKRVCFLHRSWKWCQGALKVVAWEISGLLKSFCVPSELLEITVLQMHCQTDPECTFISYSHWGIPVHVVPRDDAVGGAVE